MNKMDKLKCYTTEACFQSPSQWGHHKKRLGMNEKLGYLTAHVHSLAEVRRSLYLHFQGGSQPIGASIRTTLLLQRCAC